ncbi:MAG: heme exporter protein CcmD [Rhodobacteraceae bacterium]|nr:heme exporter protein CcmD [Paracoccaceae bacterium]
MMVDLGKYGAEVAGSYVAAIVLLVGLVVISVARARRVQRDLAQAERDE